MEVPEPGSWTELNEAHRDLPAASRTPSGIANNYGVIPDAFPAAVELTGLGALSDAVVSAYPPPAQQAIYRPVLSLPQTPPLIYVLFPLPASTAT